MIKEDKTMDENKNVMITKNGEEIPLPPTDPVEEGIVVPVTPED